MLSGIDEEHVKNLKKEFEDLLPPKGDLILSPPLPEESDEPDLLQLPRMVLDFNRKDFGRLRDLIDSINAIP
jgi:hypothetical protein